MNSLNKQVGFTLIELIMVIVVLAVIAKISSQILAQGLNSYLTMENVTDANWQGQLAIGRMVRDLRSVRSANDISVNTSSEITFVDSTGTTIDYKLSGASLMRNTQILADGINNLTFTYYDANGNVGPSATNIRYINIALTVTQKNTNYNLNTAVFLRNLAS